MQRLGGQGSGSPPLPFYLVFLYLISEKACVEFVEKRLSCAWHFLNFKFFSQYIKMYIYKIYENT